MPLKVRIKPDEKLLIGEVVILNGGERACELVILTNRPVQRKRRKASGIIVNQMMETE